MFFSISLFLFAVSFCPSICKSAKQKIKDLFNSIVKTKKCATTSMFSYITQRKIWTKDEPNCASCRLCPLFLLFPFFMPSISSIFDAHNNNTKLNDHDITFASNQMHCKAITSLFKVFLFQYLNQ